VRAAVRSHRTANTLVGLLTTLLAVLVVTVPVAAYMHGRKHAEHADTALLVSAVGVPALVLVLGSALAIAVRWRQRACYATVAQHLGLTLREGALTGEYQGCEVSIASRRHRSGGIVRRRTVVSALFSSGLGLELHACRRGDEPAHAEGPLREGTVAVTFGDVSFDRRFAVGGSSVEKVQAFFDDSRRKVVLDYQTDLLLKHYGLVVTDRAVEITAPALANPDRLLYMLPMAVAMVRELEVER